MHQFEDTWFKKTADTVLKRTTILTDRWYYSYGLALKALYSVYCISNDKRYFTFIKRYYDAFVGEDGTIQTVDPQEYNLDNINNGKLLFPLFQSTGDKRYKNAAWLLKNQLDHQPRTSEGAYWHKNIYPYQVWLDGLYMALPFTAQYITTFGDSGEEYDDIVRQFQVAYCHTRDEKSGLLYHAWDEKHVQFWCDSQTGCSKCFWGRSIGWFLMAIVDVLDFLPPEHKSRGILISMLEETLEALLKVRDPDRGVFYQVLDQGGRKGNYLESSASCMICYAMAKGVRMGYLSSKWSAIALELFGCIVNEFVSMTETGLVNIHNICTGAGLGGWNKRDGTYEYYISEAIVSNHTHGLGAFMLAGTEVEIR